MRHNFDKASLLQLEWANKIIEQEVKKKTEQVDGYIMAAYHAFFLVSLTVLADVYDASEEFVDDYLDKCAELLNQFNAGKLRLKQLDRHINDRYGFWIKEMIQQKMKGVSAEPIKAETEMGQKLAEIVEMLQDELIKAMDSDAEQPMATALEEVLKKERK